MMINVSLSGTEASTTQENELVSFLLEVFES